MEINNKDASYLVRRCRQLRSNIASFRCTADSCTSCCKVNKCDSVIDSYIELKQIDDILDKIYKK